MYFAVCQGVLVKLCVYISHEDLEYGQVHKHTCVASTEFNVNSSAARCGKPGEPVSLDGIMI